MKKTKGFWTFRYTLINILYFVAFCTIHAYAGVFLLDKGFTNTQVGLALAIANILSVFGQPLTAGIIDKGGVLTNRLVVMFSSLFLLLGSVMLIFVKSAQVPIFIVFVLMYTVQFVYQPIMIAMNFEYAKAGCKINFGLARGMGSAGFAVTSFFLGKAVADYGTGVILYVTIIAMAVMVLVVFLFKKPSGSGKEERILKSDIPSKDDLSEISAKETGNSKESEIIQKDISEKDREADLKSSTASSKAGDDAANNFFAFVKRYPFFVVFLLGSACCFFAHNMINDFMIQIINSLGGDEAQLGYATFLQAILELPVMALIGFVLKKISERYMLIFSAVSFFVKTAILIFATAMLGMYVSQSFQMFAYAVFIPTAAYFADNVMKEKDKVKGQAYINCAITLGGVFSNLASGKLLDTFGVKPMLAVGSAVCLIGVFVTVIAVIPMYKSAAKKQPV
ncbi:MAG: MFS transporter [Lachnospiraceae bacterium]|nr:MFS transporter [Lachnospiraceae bacterium]